MRFGFTSEEEEYVEPETVNYGVGHQSTVGSDNDDDDSGFTFTNHIYLAVQLGPFMFVVGRPE